MAINRVINSYSREQTMFKITSKEYIDVTMYTLTDAGTSRSSSSSTIAGLCKGCDRT